MHTGLAKAMITIGLPDSCWTVFELILGMASI
jgi:hypothetical protein